MIRTALTLPLLLAATAAFAAEPPEFEASAERFDDASGCRLYLEHLIADARRAGFDAAEGPYAIAIADVRAHTVRADGLGHRISEYRCADGALSSRSWVERMDHRADGAFSIESLAQAVWLEQGRR
jgi:hypothetical protein